MRLTSLLLLGALCAPAFAQPAAPLRLTILHTNDRHSHHEPGLNHGSSQGGSARIAALLDKLRAEPGTHLTVDAGDIFQGSPFFTLRKGAVEVEVQNRSGYQLAALGNHEFDEGPANLIEQLRHARYHVLCCNLDSSKWPALGALLRDSEVETIEGQKVGFVGAITPDLEQLSTHLQGVKLKKPGGDWIEPVRQSVAALRAQGIDKIVLVTHCGVDADRELARALPDVDVIIGGHSHTRLEQPLREVHPDGSVCWIVQTGSYGQAVGKTEIAWDSQGRLDEAASHYSLVEVDSSLPESSAVAAYLEEQARPLAARREPLGSTATAHFEVGIMKLPYDSALGDLVTDAFADYARKSGCAITLHNRGGLRERIEAGPLTRGQMEGVLPFDNKLVVAQMSGAVLRRVLDHSVAGAGTGRFFDVHGLRLVYAQARGSAPARLLSVEAQALDGRWLPLNPTATYRVALNDYNFGGGEGYNFKGATLVRNSGKRLSDFLVSYVRRHPQLVPATPARVLGVGPYLKRRGALLQLSGMPTGATAHFYSSPQGGLAPTPEGVPVPLNRPRPVTARLESGGYRFPAHSGWVSAVIRHGKHTWIAEPVWIH